MIEIVGLNKYFNRHKKNEVHVINNVSLKIDNTGLVALLGPSGSGKTTLLNTIGGLDKVQKGRIYINNKKVTTKITSKKDRIRNLSIGYIFQDYKLIEDMSVFDNIAIVLKMIGIKDKKEIKKRVEYCLNKVGMERYKNRPASMLSGGERQRVGIARAIVKAPEIIIADEPTGNLDSKNSLEIMNIIKAISREKLVILVTHERELATFYATRIIEIEDGKVIKDYENKHNNELDYKVENNFYLKDFENHEKLKDENTNINIYSNDNQKIDLNIVVKNGNIYIKSKQNEKIEVIDENSSIEMVDEHYKKINKEEIDNYEFNFDEVINKNIKKRYSSIFNPVSLIINGFNKVLDFPVLKKILLIGFFLSAMFILYAVCSVRGTLNIKDEDFITYNRNYLQIKQPNMSVEDYLRYEQDENNIYILPGDSIVSFTLALKDYYQTSRISNSITGSLSSIELIDEKQLSAGRMPQNENEIVIDKAVIQKQIDQEYSTLRMCGVLEAKDVLNREVTITNLKPFVIVGIVDLESPSIYVEKSNFINIIANSAQVDDYSFGIVISETIDETLTEQILDYKLFEEKIELAKGRLPENDYEVIVNNSHRYEMPLNKTINVTVNDKKLTVVGYYKANENVDKYLSNSNTVKYNTIKSKDTFTVYAKSKEEAINEFRKLNINIEDTYDRSRKEYLNEKQDSMKASLIVSGIILGISLIEIYLMIRSSFLSRIKEIGILRAIGVKRKDIYKMFTGEIIAITTIASVPGIILMTYILKTLSSIKFLASYFVINAFTVAVTVVFVYLFNLIVGLLPVFRVVRKTPAQILSRHDI